MLIVSTESTAQSVGWVDSMGKVGDTIVVEFVDDDGHVRAFLEGKRSFIPYSYEPQDLQLIEEV